MSGIHICPPALPELFPADGVVAVGFGSASLRRDGAYVWSEDEWPDGPYMTGEEAERLAAADPEHDWKIALYGPLQSSVYQRQGAGRWVLIERGEGFA